MNQESDITNQKSTPLLGEARNHALNKANAEWLAFLDVDDVWYKDKLEKQVDLLSSNNEEIGFIYGRCEVIYSNFPKKIIYSKMAHYFLLEIYLVNYC